MSETILVTGAAGHLGRAVLHHLLDSEGIAPSRLIATTRDPAKLAARGVAVRRADFNEPASLEQAFAGARKVLVISTDTLDLVGGRRLRQHEAAIEAAKRAGAAHIAYTSAANPQGSPFLLMPDHVGTENAIKASGLSYTIFRTNTYLEMLLLSLPGVVATGRWYTSAGNGRVAYAARDDMAAAIAAHLAGATSTESTTLTLTGPTAYTHRDVARLVTEVTGHPVEVVSVSDAELLEILQRAGVPEPFARTLASAGAHTRAGLADVTSDILEKLSRRKPRSLREFLESNKAALANPAQRTSELGA